MKKYLLIIAFGLPGLFGKAQGITNIQLLSYPNDSFKLAVNSFFMVGDISCCPPLHSFFITTSNDTIHIDLYTENILCVQQFCTRKDTITLGQVPAFSKNVVVVHPATVLEIATGVWDTTWAPQYDTFKVFPWVNGISLPETTPEIVIGPSPVHHELFISSTGLPIHDIEIEIYDLYGRKVFQQKHLSVSGTPFPVDIARVPHGVLLVALRRASGVFYQARILRIE